MFRGYWNINAPYRNIDVQFNERVFEFIEKVKLTQIKAWLSSQDGIGGGSMCFARGRIKDRYIEEDHRRRMA